MERARSMFQYFVFLLCTLLVNAKDVAKVKPNLIELNDGRKMPSFGLGTWLSDADPKKPFEPQAKAVKEAVENAIDAGYRHIDTASIYNTEKQVGEAVNKKIVDGDITREDIFITTKLWNDAHGKDVVVPTLKESLAKLNLSYVDMYLIHWPISSSKTRQLMSNEIDYLETWQGMIEARTLGFAKSIGVSNFNEAFIQRLIENSSAAPAVLQVEINLNLQQPQLLEYCRAHNIAVMGYTPFGSVFGAKSYSTSAPPPPRSTDPVLQSLAKKYKKTVAQVILRYLHELGVVPIPKSVKKERIEENINIFDFSLDQRDREQLKSFDVHFRNINPTWWSNSTYYPFEKQ